MAPKGDYAAAQSGNHHGQTVADILIEPIQDWGVEMVSGLLGDDNQ